MVVVEIEVEIEKERERVEYINIYIILKKASAQNAKNKRSVFASSALVAQIQFLQSGSKAIFID